MSRHWAPEPPPPIHPQPRGCRPLTTCCRSVALACIHGPGKDIRPGPVMNPRSRVAGLMRAFRGRGPL
ncbi:hypothetical protein J6590_046833 [Homalodisca vitripennis]|nr:hypothetical protein J6590_046833 [Homalodisca vitripennis]